MHLAAWMAMAFMLERVLLVIAKDNYGTAYNGAGAIEGVVKRSSMAPMVYRVLVPWVSYGLRRAGVPLLTAYELVKIVLTGFALWSVELAWGVGVAIMVLAILPVTYLYDYWDWAAELFGLCMCLTGNFFMSLAGVLVWGLSRETVVIGGIAYYLVTGDWLGAVAISAAGMMVLSTVHLIQGQHDRYCKTVWLRDNLVMVRNIAKYERPAWINSIVFSLAIILVAIAAAPFTGWKGILVGFLVGFGISFGKINETRVFTSLVPWVGYACLRLFVS